MDKFDKVHARRLTLLADHLENGELGLDRFDFGTFGERNSCGTSGCAIGECPTIFPEWEYRINEWEDDPLDEIKAGAHLNPCLKGMLSSASLFSAEEWFGLTEKESHSLFLPHSQQVEFGKILNSRSTRQQVAANIRAFLEYKAREAVINGQP